MSSVTVSGFRMIIPRRVMSSSSSAFAHMQCALQHVEGFGTHGLGMASAWPAPSEFVKHAVRAVRRPELPRDDVDRQQRTRKQR